jgi:hypothetical protein
MKGTEVAVLICQDLNTYDEESLTMQPITNGVDAVQYLNQQWVSPQIQVKEATDERLKLAINENEVVITNRNVFGDWQIEY